MATLGDYRMWKTTSNKQWRCNRSGNPRFCRRKSNPAEMQQVGVAGYLNSFKQYTETYSNHLLKTIKHQNFFMARVSTYLNFSNYKKRFLTFTNQF